MAVTFGIYTLYGLVAGILIPLAISFFVWVLVWLSIFMFLNSPIAADRDSERVPAFAFRAMMQAQYYPLVILQPLHWALPWMVVLSTITLPAGILLDNGVVFGFWTQIFAALTVLFATVVFLILRHALDEVSERWIREIIEGYFVLVVIVILLLLSGTGILIDNLP